jgi:hypothetical protein
MQSTKTAFSIVVQVELSNGFGGQDSSMLNPFIRADPFASKNYAVAIKRRSLYLERQDDFFFQPN